MNKSGATKNFAIIIGTMLLLVGGASAQRQMEKLGRGVVAIDQGDGKVYLGWRMLGTDPASKCTSHKCRRAQVRPGYRLRGS